MKSNNLVKLLLVSVILTTVALGFLPQAVQQTKALGDSATQWYLRDQDVGVQLVGNMDNTGKALFCVRADDCKAVYYDYTNGDLKFFDCDDANCFSGTATTVDSLDDVGDQLSLYCPSSSDCKIAYIDETTTALLFYDCDDSACSSGTRTVVDGDTGCALAGGVGCSATRTAGTYPIVFCPAADDCKIAYAINGARDLYFADCDDATCSSGSISIVDGADNCSLVGCLSDHPRGNQVGQHISLYCLSSTDCKISVKNGSTDDLRFEDCDNSACSAGTSTLLDGNVGCSLTGGMGCSTTDDAGKHSTLYCPTTDDCKIAYVTNTNTSLRLADCDDAACTSGSISYLDGEAGCSIAGCVESAGVQQPSIYCPAADDCKVAYKSNSFSDLRLVDCADEACDQGTITVLDGPGGCSLANCAGARVGLYASLYCPAADDCKAIYYDEDGGNLKFADCQDAACSAGTTVTIDGNKIVEGAAGRITTNRAFGTSAGQTITYVSAAAYPMVGGDSLGAGSYTLHLNFTNNISVGALSWHYQVGYCTIASDCTDKTYYLASTEQSFTAGTSSPQDIVVTTDTPLDIPSPDGSNWVFVELSVSSQAGGSITLNMNNAVGGPGDTNLAFVPDSPPTPTDTMTPGPTQTPTPIPGPSTLTVQVSSSADDVNEDGSTYKDNLAATFLGDGNATNRGYLSLRFNNVSIPAGATIQSAHLEVYSYSTGQTVPVSMVIGADQAGDSPPFTSANRPSRRTLTVAQIAFDLLENWDQPAWYALPEINLVVQEIVDRADWQAGNSLSIIIRGNGQNAKRLLYSYDGSPLLAAQLQITYTVP